MLKIIIVSSLILHSVVGFRDEYDPSKFYNSGWEYGDDAAPHQFYNSTGFAVLSLPFNFKYNNYNDPLPAGYYQLEPIITDNKPVQINLRKVGKVVGTITIIDYKILSYKKSSPSASLEMINNGTMAQISLLYDKYELHGIVELFDGVP